MGHLTDGTDQPVNDRMLTLDRLRHLDRRGRGRHGRHGVHRHAGTAAGQAAARAATSSTWRSAHGTEGCNYLLAVDVDMNTVDGYAISSWERGLRRHGVGARLAHAPAADPPARHRHGAVRPGLARPLAGRRSRPRTILQAQIDRAAELGFTAHGRHRAGVHRLRGHLRGRRTPRLPRPDAGQPVQRRLLRSSAPPGSSRCCATSATTCTPRGWTSRAPRASATSASTRSASSTTTCWSRPTTTSVYKNAAKEIAAQHGKSITFMAKYDEREGNSCHIHLSLRGADGGLVFWDEQAGGRTRLYDQFVAGVLATTARLHAALRARTSTPTSASPTASFAPTTIAWGMDNRTCAVRLVGHGQSAPGWRTGSRAATSTPTWRWRR